MEAFCPSCGAQLRSSDSRCPKCHQVTAGARYPVTLEGWRFAMPARCACCLQPTERTTRYSRGDSSGTGIETTSFNLPHCASCARTAPLFTAACALTWPLGLLIVVNLSSGPAYLIALPLVLFVAALLVLPRVPPFRRIGHVRRCVAARIHRHGIELHNRAFANVCESR